jgi:hypothetical protein
MNMCNWSLGRGVLGTQEVNHSGDPSVLRARWIEEAGLVQISTVSLPGLRAGLILCCLLPATCSSSSCCLRPAAAQAIRRLDLMPYIRQFAFAVSVPLFALTRFKDLRSLRFRLNNDTLVNK